MPSVYTSTILIGTPENNQQLFEEAFSKRYDNSRGTPVVTTIHEELLGKTHNKNYRDQLDDLLSIAEMASTIIGTKIEFPPIDIVGEALKITGEYKEGVYDGAVDLSFAIQTPQIFKTGIFIKPDDYGRTISSLMGDEIPLWKMRFTPYRERQTFSILSGPKQPTPVALVAASQRFIGQDDYSISTYRKGSNRDNLLKSGMNIFEIFNHCYNDQSHLPGYIDQSEVYVFRGIPGNYLLNYIEKALGMKSHEIFTLLGIAALQNAGFHTIRCVSDDTQPSLAGHRAKGHTEQASFNYDELCDQYFEWDPRLIDLGHNAYVDKDRYPWLLEHAGNQLGVKNGQSAMSPEFIRYLSQTGDPSNN